MILIIYLTGVVACYFMAKAVDKRYGHYSEFARCMNIAGSLITSWLGFIASIFDYILAVYRNDKPAKW